MDANSSDTNLPGFIQRVSSWITQKEPKIAQLETERDQLATRLSKAEGDLAASKAELATANQTIQTLTTERDNARKEAKEAKELIEKPEGEINKRANLLAGEKISKLGIRAPVADASGANPTSSGKALTWTERCKAALGIK